MDVSFSLIQTHSEARKYYKDCSRQDSRQSFPCRQWINACSVAPRDLFFWKKTYNYTKVCDISILSNWTQGFYMCTRWLLTLLAANSARSRLKPAGGISPHFPPSLLVGTAIFPNVRGPGPALACPTLPAAPPTEPVPGNSGSRQFPGSSSGLRIRVW
jgi:hypothetical protein